MLDDLSLQLSIYYYGLHLLGDRSFPELSLFSTLQRQRDVEC